MARNSKPRKKYRPKPALVRPMTMGVNEDDARTLKLIPHDELRKLRTGEGNEFTFNTLACRLNVGYVLSERNEFTVDLKPHMKAALDALVAVKERHGKLGKWVATGDELRAIGQGLVYADDMQDATTRREHRDALHIVLEKAT